MAAASDLPYSCKVMLQDLCACASKLESVLKEKEDEEKDRTEKSSSPATARTLNFFLPQSCQRRHQATCSMLLARSPSTSAKWSSRPWPASAGAVGHLQRAIQLPEEKMPPKDPAAGQSRSQGVNLYIKNLASTSECQT